METTTRDNQVKTVLITGATGFLGEYLTQRLKGGYRVLALGRNKEKGEALEKLGAVFCPGDFTDPKTCAMYFKGVHYVIHAGALSTVWGKWEDFYRTNVLGTSVVAGLCAENSVTRLIYISSPSIYTDRQDRYDIREEQAPDQNQLNYYIQSKLMAEQIIGWYSGNGLATVILRPRGLIGIGDKSLVPRLLRANACIGIPLMRGGHNMVDLTSVENVAQACELALTSRDAAGKVFNITNGEPMEFKALLEQFLESIGEQPHYRRLPFKAVYGAAAAMEWLYRTFGLPGEPPLTRYTVCTLGFAQTMDIGRAREILGYRPEKTLGESIEEYGRWWREERDGEEQAEKNARTGESTGIPAPPSQIIQVKLYHCGYCVNNLRRLFKGQEGRNREFPAMAALLRHKELGCILFDAGYSETVYQGGLFLKMYRLLNPVHLDPYETIDKKLTSDGVRPEDVKTVILSHAHPDHIGGLSKLREYDLVASDETLKAMDKPSLRNLVFSGMVPDEKSVRSRRRPEKRLSRHFLCGYFEQVYDLFGDGSVIGVGLDGHCKGQLGIWIPDFCLFLAADACWGDDLVRYTLGMRSIPRLIQNNFTQYKNTLRRLCRLKRDYPQISIVFTHQKGKERTYG